LTRIVFCGVGALGSTAAVLCRNVEATLAFVDFDRVESKNLVAQAYVKPSVGKNKAEALKHFDEAIKIGEVRGGAYKEALEGKRRLTQP